MSGKQENAKVNEGTGDQEFTADNPCSNLAANENLVNVKVLERSFDEGIGKERVIFVDTL